MPKQRSTAPGAQSRQAVVQLCGEAFDPEHLDARCGELDRQRQAIEPPANLADKRGVRIGQREVLDDRVDTLDEQLHSRESSRLSGRQSGRWRRAGERPETILAFARYPERLPAGREDADARRPPENRRCQPHCRVNDILASVEQQQHPLVSEVRDHAGKQVFGVNFKPEHTGNRARHQARFPERCQIDEPHTVLSTDNTCDQRVI
jgi:hypothetical protein